MKNLRAIWTKHEKGVYDEDEVLQKLESLLYNTGVMQEGYGAESFDAEVKDRHPTLSKKAKSEYVFPERNIYFWSVVGVGGVDGGFRFIETFRNCVYIQFFCLN